ncbi:hypothetical protein AVEN_26276-1 [Araneus ventricosus]|uniref:Uncharacterized protein n=1 Tax=Araneus ventricosus TaxID=182803 RepID=A0A4Y2AM05_ARAVE|nr:hypothetical protein AVEN_26276-1 [Araneus ventricosus]
MSMPIEKVSAAVFSSLFEEKLVPGKSLEPRLGGQWKCLKSEECSWSHLVATLDAWGVALSCWNCPNPSECTMDMNGCRMLKYLSESSLDVSGIPYHANCTRPMPSQRLHQI